MNVLSPASPSHSIASAFDPFAESSSSTTTTTTAETRSPPPAPSSGAATAGAAAPSTGGATGLGRKNTLKAYLANKHKLKDRQSINIVVNTNAGAAQDSPASPDNAMSPRTASRMEQSLEELDRQKAKVEERLAALTKEMLHYQPGHHYTTATGTTIISSPVDGVAPSLFDTAAAADGSSAKAPAALPGVRPLAELQQSKATLVAQLDQILKERRTLLQSWSRDYKNLKRSGSLKQPSPENYWFSPN